MKTAVEISTLIMGQFVDSAEAVELIKEYGKHVGEQVLKGAVYNADLEHWTGRPYEDSEFRVRATSILKTKIITP